MTMTAVFSVVITATFLILSSLSVAQSKCFHIPNSGTMCTNKPFDPKDILAPITYTSVGLFFNKMEGETRFSVPAELSEQKYENAVYKTFSVEDSCVQHIEERFFVNLDRNNSKLTEIRFEKVRCLTTLSEDSFRGVGPFVKTLSFKEMPDLRTVGDDFFDGLNVLEKLTITKTSIKHLSGDLIAKMTKVRVINLSNNQLTSLPTIPGDRKDFFSRVSFENNPFHCQCSLAPFVVALKEITLHGKFNLYICSTPETLRGKVIFEVDLCTRTMEPLSDIPKKTLDEKTVVATATVRMEIIIAVSLTVLVIIILVLVVVLYKRHRGSKKHTIVTHQMSPSKIVYQTDNDSAQPFMTKYEL